MNLSPHFTLFEMQYSPTAIRLGIDNSASPFLVARLTKLCVKILEPIRTRFGIVHITSGYRCEELNTIIGGAKNSQHVQGEAADIHIDGYTTEELYTLIKHLGLPYSQLIQEFSNWVHVSYDGGSRHENLRATKVNGHTVYAPDNT